MITDPGFPLNTEWMRGISMPAGVQAAHPPTSLLGQRVASLSKPQLSKGSTQRGEELENAVDWETARLSALFNAMYASGVVTEVDTEKLKEIFAHINKLENQMHQLNPQERRKLREKIAKIKECGTEIFHFAEVCKGSDATMSNNFDKALKVFNEQIAAEHVILRLREITLSVHNVLKSLETLQRAIEILPEGPFKMREEWDLEQKKKLLSFSLDPLNEAINKEVDRAVNYLKTEWKRSKSEESGKGLHDLRYLIEDGVSLLRGENAPFPDIKKDILNICHVLDTKKSALSNLIASVPSPDILNTDFEALPWRQHYQEEVPSSFLKRAVSALNPEHWSDQTKDIVFRLTAFWQLSAQGLQTAHQLYGTKRKADALQQQVIQAVPPAQTEKIDRETSFLGTLLVDKYGSLTPESMTKFSKGRSDAFHQALNDAKALFGTHQPNEQQVIALMNAFRMAEMVKASPGSNPLHHMGFREWWSIFNANEVNQASSPAEKPDVEMFANERPYWPKFVEYAGKAHAGGMLAKEIERGTTLMQHSYNSIADGMVLSSSLLTQLMLMKQELDRVEAPSKDWSLLQLAAWMQKVEDLHFNTEELVTHHIYLEDIFGDDSVKQAERFESVINGLNSKNEFSRRVALLVLKRALADSSSGKEKIDWNFFYWMFNAFDQSGGNLSPLMPDIEAYLLKTYPNPANNDSTVFLENALQKKSLQPHIYPMLINLLQRGALQMKTVDEWTRYGADVPIAPVARQLFLELKPVINELLKSVSLESRKIGIEWLSYLESQESDMIPVAQRVLEKGIVDPDYPLELYPSLLLLLEKHEIRDPFHPHTQKMKALLEDKIGTGLVSPDLKTRLQASYLFQASLKTRLGAVSKAFSALGSAGRDFRHDGEHLAEEGITAADSEISLAALQLTQQLLSRPAPSGAAIFENDFEAWRPKGEAILQQGLNHPSSRVQAKARDLLDS